VADVASARRSGCPVLRALGSVTAPKGRDRGLAADVDDDDLATLALSTTGVAGATVAVVTITGASDQTALAGGTPEVLVEQLVEGVDGDLDDAEAVVATLEARTTVDRLEGVGDVTEQLLVLDALNPDRLADLVDLEALLAAGIDSEDSQGIAITIATADNGDSRTMGTGTGTGHGNAPCDEP
jgi:hypothetical protein